MKKIILIIALCVGLVFSLTSCRNEEAHKDRYSIGYDEGYHEGVSDAQEHLKDRIQDLSWDVKEAHGIYPEDALQILVNYADGEPITEAQLHQAIWAIHQYFWDSYEDINDIDSYY